MASSEYWRSIQELLVIARVAGELGIAAGLRGSVAGQLLNAALSNRFTRSLFDRVAAFADINLMTNTETDAARLHDAINRELGDSRFFHWELRTIGDLARYRELANVNLDREPTIVFASEQARPFPDDTWQDSAFLRIGFDPEKRAFDIQDRSDIFAKHPPGIRAIEGVKNPAEALADLLYILRRFPYLGEDRGTRFLVDYLRETGGSNVAADLRSHPGAYRRTIFEFLKFLVQYYAQGAPRPEFDAGIERLLGSGFCNEFAQAFANPILGKLMRLAQEPRATGTLVATVVPRLNTQAGLRRWLRRVDDAFVVPVNSAVESPHWLAFEAEDAAESAQVRVIAPPATIETDDPPDPGCCGYRDFDRGIAEIAWIGPPGSQLAHRRFALAAKGHEANEHASFLAHAYLNAGSISSLRCDYGFLCIGAGGKSDVSIYRMDESDAD